MVSRFSIVTASQGRATEREMGTHPLPKRAALTAFPRLEVAGADECQGAIVLACLVIERAKFHAQIVALLDERDIFFQFAPTLCGLFTETFPKLIAFVQHSRIGRIGLERPIISGSRPDRLVANVEIADAQIAPDNGKLRVKFD